MHSPICPISGHHGLKTAKNVLLSMKGAMERIRSSIAEGSSYEAQQTLKTMHHRCRAKKQMDESYAVLRDGAVMQLEKGQVTCGVELGLLLVEASQILPWEGPWERWHARP